jgi:hypothetical protein
MSSRPHSDGSTASTFSWWLLAAILGFAKLIVFVMDSNPQVILGDSMSYLTTAALGWIPPDRSFVYGFLVYNVTTRARSLSSLVAVQTCAGMGTALLTALILVRFIRAPFPIAAAMAVALALEPQQLLYERFVMTESLSTALFTLFLFLALEYLRARKIGVLIADQIIGVILIAFRVAYLPVVVAATFLAPFLACVAWAEWSETQWHVRKRAVVRLAIHLSISVSVFAGLHTAYKRWNGYLSKLPPAYVYADGLSLLTTVSPLVTPADTDVPELVPVLSRPLAYANSTDELTSRKAELFSADGLVARLREVLQDDFQTNVEARRIAFRVIRRDPLGCIHMAFQTYLKFYSRKYMTESMRQEAGMRELEPAHLKILLHYHLDAQGLPFMKTVTRQYYLASWPLYILLVHSPLALLVCIVVAPPNTRTFLWLLVLTTGVHLATIQLVEVEPSTRYLHPAVVPLAIAIGICAASPRRRDRDVLRSPPKPGS